MMRKTAFYLIEKLMETKNLTKEEALSTLLKTTVYEALMDEETFLYLESKEAVLDILLEELSGNIYRILEF